MKANLYNQTGENIGDVELSDKVFGLKMNFDLVRQALQAHLANSRQVLAHTKDRSEVRGGGKKPWRQKGTGRARHASIRSPIWVGGGVAFGPRKNRNFSKKINKKVKNMALRMALSSKVKDKEFLVLDNLSLPEVKTKQALAILNNLIPQFEGYRKSKKKQDSILMITPKSDKDIVLAYRNMPFMEILSAKNLNIREILEKKYVIMFKNAASVIEETFK